MISDNINKMLKSPEILGHVINFNHIEIQEGTNNQVLLNMNFTKV